MKRWFGILFLVLCLQVRLVAADEIKDNRLQIDTSRVEQDTNTDQMGQNPLVADLFNEDDSKKIDEYPTTYTYRQTRVFKHNLDVFRGVFVGFWRGVLCDLSDE